jgi:hypothetical protein
MAAWLFRQEKNAPMRHIQFDDIVAKSKADLLKRFLAELFACRGIGEQAREQNLDGDIPVELLIMREVDDAHSAGTDLIHDPVM